jgi:hypothetical protein
VIKLVCFFRRKPGMSVADFQRHWLENHGPLIADTPELSQHVLRYEQNHRLGDDYGRVDACSFDGATVQWLESMRSFGAFVREPAYRELIAPDERRFIDPESISLLFTADDDVKIRSDAAREQATVKLLCLLKRKPGLEPEEFHEHWRGPHASLFTQTPEIARHVTAYHQSHRLDRDYDRDRGGGYDGLAEQWYASMGDFEALVREPAYAEQIAPDEDRFIDREALTYLLSAPPQLIIG